MDIERIESYKPSVSSVVDRMLAMDKAVGNGRTGNIIFRAYMVSDNIYEKFDLTRYNYETDTDEYIKELIDIHKASFEARRLVLDDVIPFFVPFLGIADYSAFLDGEISFAKDTSWSDPTIKEWKDMDRIKSFGSAPFYKKLINILNMLVLYSKDSGIPVNRGFYSPLDLAYALRGQSLFTDFYEDGENVHKLLGLCTEATIYIAEKITDIISRNCKKGDYSDLFFRKRISMSEDTACMISPDHYREFGAPYTQKVIDRFGKASLHSHSRALYLVKDLCSLRGVCDIWIATDPNQPRPIDHLDELIDISNGVCLSADCTDFDEIKKNTKAMLRGNISLSVPENDTNKINEITEYIRSVSNI